MAEASAVDPPRGYRVDDLTLDLRAHTLRRGDQLIDLPELSWRLFVALARGATDGVSKDDLMQEVWGSVVVGDETLAQRVRLLRQALGDDGQNPHYIASVRGRGYRLIGPVTPLASSPRQATPRSRRVIGMALAGGLAALAVAAAILLSGPDDGLEAPATTPGSLAVLPFADLSEQGDQAYLADGMHEELLSRLASVDGLAVTSRTSVIPYRSTQLGVPEIASMLGVSAIVEGSVRRASDRVRITAQLIDGKTDRHLWGASFERTLTIENLFEIQNEIAGHIAQALSSKLSTDPPRPTGELPTTDLAAYDLYLRGRFHTFRSTADDLDQAVTFLTQATQRDPKFANAYAALGTAYSFQGTSYGSMPPAEAFAKAKEAALAALALDPDLIDARALYADILTWYDWDWAAAEVQYRQCMRAQPDVMLGYALLLSALLRHDEALALVESAVRKFPDDRFVRSNAAWRFYNARDYGRAISEAQASVDHPDRLPILGFAELARGNTAQALAYFEQDVKTAGESPARLSNLAVGLLRNQRNDEANAILHRLLDMRAAGNIAGHPVDPTLLAAVYFETGDLEQGFAMLDEAREERMRGMVFLQVSHSYDNVRQDPRYQRLVKAMGFPAPP